MTQEKKAVFILAQVLNGILKLINRFGLVIIFIIACQVRKSTFTKLLKF
jgi:hypothetical protein